MSKRNDTWDNGDPYEYFMGRWSKLMAPVFLDWLKFLPNSSWLDLGCGTGALSEAIHDRCEPSQLSCVDPSPELLGKANQRLHGFGDFVVGTAADIPKGDDSFDIIVSGLALNFFPDLHISLIEMQRVLKPGGTVAAYVWDYGGRMDFLRAFWDAAGEIDPAAQKFDEGNRFTICDPVELEAAFKKAGLNKIQSSFLIIETIFQDFDDYWNPFLGKQGPAPGYLASLPERQQGEIKERVRKKLPISGDGSISLLARAIAIRGIS